MTKYTDDQINEAIMLANHTGKVYAWETEMYRDVIDYLPDADNEWEPSNVTYVRKGDRVRWTVPGCEDNESYEIVVAAVTNQDGVVLHSETRTYYFPPGSVVDRIPAPVDHPNPAEHPVILIREAVVKHDPPVVAIAMRERVCNELIYVFGEYGALSPTKITDWSPAKVVADNE